GVDREAQLLVCCPAAYSKTNRSKPLMTIRAAAVAEALSGDRQELPLVAAGMERQLQHAVRVVVPDQAGIQRLSERIVQTAACSDDELANPFLVVRVAIRCLGRKALIV